MQNATRRHAAQVEAVKDALTHVEEAVLLQLMVWHEGYPHSQITLALKATGCPITDEEARPVIWDGWMLRKSGRPHALSNGLL